MNFNDYQKTIVKNFILYPKIGSGIVYPTIGLAGEVGEFCNKVKKIFRDQNGAVDNKVREYLSSELGDILWYVAACAHELGLDFDAIAEENIAKLFARKSSNTINGDGDR